MKEPGSRTVSRKTAVTCGGVTYRMLGSLSEADDAVQETWLRESERLVDYGRGADLPG